MEKEVIISIKGMQKYENAEPDTIELVTGGRLERDGESFTLSYQESAVTGMDWLALVMISFVLPAVLCWAGGKLMRLIGWIRPGDLKLD